MSAARTSQDATKSRDRDRPLPPGGNVDNTGNWSIRRLRHRSSGDNAINPAKGQYESPRSHQDPRRTPTPSPARECRQDHGQLKTSRSPKAPVDPLPTVETSPAARVNLDAKKTRDIDRPLPRGGNVDNTGNNSIRRLRRRRWSLEDIATLMRLCSISPPDDTRLASKTPSAS